ncbi:MAG: non-heme iron oxygenase ferredoxin subunit [bacterium]|jgi:nitrite reductase/ring-hydroxylating ferredoxin subunit|nr:non-heme iron oxygenase ferredoxin subunit [bacterium]
MAGKYQLGSTKDIPEGYSKVYSVEDRRIAVFHIDGSFYAIDDACPHAGASLSEGIRERCTVVCTWHYATFDLRTGRCTVPGAFDDVQSYPVIVEGDRVILEIPPSPTGE